MDCHLRLQGVELWRTGLRWVGLRWHIRQSRRRRRCSRTAAADAWAGTGPLEWIHLGGIAWVWLKLNSGAVKIAESLSDSWRADFFELENQSLFPLLVSFKSGAWFHFNAAKHFLAKKSSNLIWLYLRCTNRFRKQLCHSCIIGQNGPTYQITTSCSGDPNQFYWFALDRTVPIITKKLLALWSSLAFKSLA